MERKPQAKKPARNDWYRDSVVNLHIDNHSALVGKGHTVEQLVAMVRDIPVEMIQVSAFGAVGTTTYPTAIRPHPHRGDWDTLAVWREVARRVGTRFGVYINTRGLRITRDHPAWTQLDAAGKGRGRHGGLDLCVRPSADGTGALETIFLPMLKEIVSRYQPDAVWVDGDHARTATCYCAHCKAAWHTLTGKAEPPTNPTDPVWPQWLELEQQRFDAYRKQMADVVHAANPRCMYTSNHSWRFRSKDPRCAPRWVDTLSGDLSHGPALRSTRLSAMQLSAEERLPCDIMHNIARIAGHKASLRRVCQQGGLTFACGGAWFLWVPGSTIVQPPMQKLAKACATFATARKAALGRSTSMNQVAVLLSETSWHRDRIEGKQGHYDKASPEHAALALQDAGYGVDIDNEATLCSRIGHYRTVVVANQRSLAATTLGAVRRFAANGGLVLVTGAGLRPDDEREDPTIAQWLGVSRRRRVEGRHRSRLGEADAVFGSWWDAQAAGAEVLARFADGRPLLTRRRVGRGAVAYLAAAQVAYPDEDGLLAWAMRALGNGPAVHVVGAARDRHLVFALRRKPGRVILHATNLTAHVRGKRVVSAMAHDIDAEPPLAQVELALPLPTRPRSVRAVPATTQAKAEWKDGILRLTLRNVDVHAAAIIEAEPAGPLPYLSADTPMAARRSAFTPIAESFESLPVGKPVPPSIGITRVGGRTAVRVTDKLAASGSRCLEFVDRADAPLPFQPYFFARPQRLDRGVGRMAFDLRLDAKAVVMVELREVENARQFPVGPSLNLSHTGGLRAFGKAKPLASLPAGTWMHVDILFPLDGGEHYTLKLRERGKAEQVFRNLRYRDKSFWRCGWAGICGIGKADAVFHVDNLTLDRIEAD